MYGLLAFCLLWHIKKRKKKHTKSSNMPTPTTNAHTTITTTTTTSLNPLASCFPTPYHPHLSNLIPFYCFHKARQSFRVKMENFLVVCRVENFNLVIKINNFGLPLVLYTSIHIFIYKYIYIAFPFLLFRSRRLTTIKLFP